MVGPNFLFFRIRKAWVSFLTCWLLPLKAKNSELISVDVDSESRVRLL